MFSPKDPVLSSRTGLTPDGYKFKVPHTTDMFETLISPRKWGAAEVLTLICMIAQLLTIPLISVLPKLYYVFAFAFWRFGYNVGLARILHSQSNSNSVTNWVETSTPSACALLNFASTKSMASDYSWDKVPPSFNAWLVFRALSMLILANDGVSYFVLAVSCFNPLHTSSYLQIAVCLPVGIALMVLSFWSKAAAHHVLGDFAWYWGDFFFTVDGTLVFDGVFELFPHPMYTVGYAGYYGSALICRSYPLLAVSLIAHIAQLLFLAFVEEPHIQKIYPSSPNPTPSTSCSSNLNDSPSVLESPHNIRQEFIDATPQKPAFLTLFTLFASVLLLSISANPSVPIVLVLLLGWHSVHWVTVAVSLRKGKEKDETLWMQWCSEHGYSRTQTFANWQHILLSSFMMRHALFLIAFVTISPSTPSTLSKTLSHVLAGSSLITIAGISMASTWRAIGYFGFFYGDFFVHDEDNKIEGKGAFRYVSYPEAMLCYLAYYGLALIKRSNGLFLAALACQAMHLLFVQQMEWGNMELESSLARKGTALEEAAFELPMLSVVRSVVHRFVIELFKLLDVVATKHANELYRNVTVRKERLQADFKKSIKDAKQWHVERHTKKLKRKAKLVVGDFSCDNLVSMLENRGIVVQRVAPYGRSTQ